VSIKKGLETIQALFSFFHGWQGSDRDKARGRSGSLAQAMLEN
jgi:hypothetical protein